MQRLSWRVAGFCLSLSAASLSRLAVAQDAADADAGVEASATEGAPPPLAPPQLRAASEAAYPEQARELRLEGSVLLALTIDAGGQVTAAEVLAPAGHGFDEAAREAALRFRFEPARRAGQPIAARVRYRYVFTLPPPEPAVAAPLGAVAAEAPGGAAVAALPAGALTNTPAADPGAAGAVEPQAAPSGTVDVAVQGAKSEAQVLQHSAEAVSVVDMRTAKQQTADLGEVLARTPGISVQREAGIGSETRISLNGLQGLQVKFFVDGIPLDESGYPALADIPVNLVERIEVYRGVVPARFGADALGGAVNVVTDMKFHAHGGASYQSGSFGTHRATALARYQDEKLGLLVGVSGFFDSSENNYKNDVNIPGPDGRVSEAPTTVKRNHDAYRAYGTKLDVGTFNRPWARRLTLTGFLTGNYKEYQNNLTQTTPYGELRGIELTYGATLRYDVDLARNLSLEATANYAHTNFHFIDLANWVYDWYGNRVRARKAGGEIDALHKSDLTTWQDAVFGRAILQWSLSHEHIVRLTSSLSAPWRGGHEAVITEANQRDTGDGRRRMVTIVSGLEYEANASSDRLTNTAFVKHYWQYNTGEDPAPFVPGDAWNKREHTINRIGLGDYLRYRLLSFLYAKASYEYATRVPEPEEFFGDARLISPNYDLKPEISHNANFNLRAELASESAGELTVDVNAFWRDIGDLILPVGRERKKYVNVRSTRSLGIDGSMSYLSPGRYLALNGMLSWQDMRNTSRSGEYKQYYGVRIPTVPWLFANWGARLSFANVLFEHTRLEPFYNARYIHSFNRSWDNWGLDEFRVVMPPQVTHSAGVTWISSTQHANLSVTLEVDNFTDAKLYDYFGAQRPGRAYYVKVTGDLR